MLVQRKNVNINKQAQTFVLAIMDCLGTSPEGGANRNLLFPRLLWNWVGLEGKNYFKEVELSAPPPFAVSYIEPLSDGSLT